MAQPQAGLLDPSLYIYVDSINSNLICCICRMPFIDPVVTRTCAHTFCRDCISCALAVNPQCPVDRSSVSEQDLASAATIVRNLVDELIVECPHRSAGCSHNGQRQHLASHISESCEYVQVQCSHPSCAHSVLKKDVGKHSEDCVHRLAECEACGRDIKITEMEAHHSECPTIEITCVHCTITMPRSALTTHLNECEFVPIPCPLASYGCGWIGPRRTLTSDHTSHCPYEAIRGFFKISDSRFAALESENQALKGRISDLERTVRSHERDLHAAKHRLGPWFRPSSEVDDAEMGQNGSSESFESSFGSRSMRRRLSAPLNAASFGTTETPVQDDTSDPYAYFAGFRPQPTSPTTEPRNPHGSPLMSHSASATHAQPALSPPFYLRSASQSITVAPVNLSTTLEGTLSSLRGSIVALSGSLDSLERKQDIMLTTETLRMHEDVASLRAIVHGLRMQVHTMMMDRNSQVTGRLAHLGMNGALPPMSSSPTRDGSQGQEQSAPTVSATYSALSRFPQSLFSGYSVPPTDAEIETPPTPADIGVSSAARYHNQHPPMPYNLSPSVTTSTTVRRAFYENKL